MSNKHARVDKGGDRSRLERFIQKGTVIEYMTDNADRQFASVRWSVYGAWETNEVFVRVTNGSRVFVRAAPSELAFPVMRDRIWGIDVRDLRLAGDLSAAIWNDHGRELEPGL